VFFVTYIVYVSTAVAIKYISDVYYTNDFMAYLGGVTLHEFANLEISFIGALAFDLYILPEKFAEFYTSICEMYDRENMAAAVYGNTRNKK